MKEKEIISFIKNIAYSENITQLKDNQYKVVVSSKEVNNVLTKLKNNKYEHLSLISATDWIDENKFEIVYIVHSYETKIDILISTFIDRKKAEMETMKHLWPIVSTYEREIFEMFGIDFIGNDDKRPFVLEGWKGKPPMRKDFDLNKYANKKFDRRKYA